MDAPHRIGAALTCARRYSLFALVGVAGEYDLGAPDAAAPSPVEPPPLTGLRANRPRAFGKRPALLSKKDSLRFRDHMLLELNSLKTEDDLLAWASHNHSKKLQRQRQALSQRPRCP